MPVHKTKSGGYKYGKTGKPIMERAKNKAQKQARAIYAGGYKGK